MQNKSLFILFLLFFWHSSIEAQKIEIRGILTPKNTLTSIYSGKFYDKFIPSIYYGTDIDLIPQLDSCLRFETEEIIANRPVVIDSFAVVLGMYSYTQNDKDICLWIAGVTNAQDCENCGYKLQLAVFEKPKATDIWSRKNWIPNFAIAGNRGYPPRVSFEEVGAGKIGFALWERSYKKRIHQYFARYYAIENHKILPLITTNPCICNVLYADEEIPYEWNTELEFINNSTLFDFYDIKIRQFGVKKDLSQIDHILPFDETKTYRWNQQYELKDSVANIKFIPYVVQKQDNFGTLTKKFDMDSLSLKEWNVLADCVVQIGDVIFVKDKAKPITIKPPSVPKQTIPPSITTPKPPLVDKPPKIISTQKGRTEYHIVKQGETLTKIAEEYGITVAQLKQWNKKTDNSLLQGEWLRVFSPISIVPKPPQIPVVKPKFHIVENGDTLTNIAKRHNTTVTALKQRNNLTNDTIHIGQKITLP